MGVRYEKDMLEHFSYYADYFFEDGDFLNALGFAPSDDSFLVVTNAGGTDASVVSSAAQLEFVELLESVQRDMTVLQKEIDDLQAKLAALPLPRSGPDGAELVETESALQEVEVRLRRLVDAIREGKTIEEQRASAERVMLAMVPIRDEVAECRARIRDWSTA